MGVKIKRLLTDVCTVAVAAALLAVGAYAAPGTPDDSWMAAVNWEDAKEGEPETTVASTTAQMTTTQPTPSDEQVTVSGKKTWNHGDNPVAKRPDSITVIVKADGAVVVQRLVTAADHWAWSFMLPKYGKNGRDITYTVNEARFEDYVKMVDGYNLTNIYMPGRNTDEPWPPGTSGGSLPKTDDNSNLTLWLALMGASLFGLTLVSITQRRKRREENRS